MEINYMKHNVKKIEWKDVLPIWKNHLWKDRKSKIKPTNGLNPSGYYDVQIEYYIPTFFGVFNNNNLIGVNSGHATSKYNYRSRGIYILPEYRK